jgi:hypothetical protein
LPIDIFPFGAVRNPSITAICGIEGAMWIFSKSGEFTHYCIVYTKNRCNLLYRVFSNKNYHIFFSLRFCKQHPLNKFKLSASYLVIKRYSKRRGIEQVRKFDGFGNFRTAPVRAVRAFVTANGCNCMRVARANLTTMITTHATALVFCTTSHP